MRRLRIAAILLALAVSPIGLVGCRHPTTQTLGQPNSPQTQVLNVTRLLSGAINAAVKTGIVLRDQGKFSQADNLILQNWAKSAVVLDDKIAVELASKDSWTAQRSTILALLLGFKIPAMSGVDPTLQASLALVMQLVSQIQSQVSQ